MTNRRVFIVSHTKPRVASGFYRVVKVELWVAQWVLWSVFSFVFSLKTSRRPTVSVLV
jgi:hypothetical protein